MRTKAGVISQTPYIEIPAGLPVQFVQCPQWVADDLKIKRPDPYYRLAALSDEMREDPNTVELFKSGSLSVPESLLEHGLPYTRWTAFLVACGPVFCALMSAHAVLHKGTFAMVLAASFAVLLSSLVFNAISPPNPNKRPVPVDDTKGR